MAFGPDNCLKLPFVQEAISRGFMDVDGSRITYRFHRERSESWLDPEEWVRCAVGSFLIVERDYSPARMDTEVLVPRRVPGDYADIVVFRDDRCRDPYLVVETKAYDQRESARRQAIEQAIGNAHSLRAPLAMYDDWSTSLLFDTSGAYPAGEREANRRGDRGRIPSQYLENAPVYRFVAGTPDSDIAAADSRKLERKIRKAHSLIWAGGKRDPLTAFDQWSRILFAKVHDERTTPNGTPRRFQIGAGETATAVANRIHQTFATACDSDSTIFPPGIRIELPDEKIRDVVDVLQDISIVDTSIDTIGHAFERFFGSVFRGELGQYFTMRQIARFTVAAVGVSHDDYVIDPTAGSGGFLLEALLQCWHRIDKEFEGRPELDRKKYDFAHLHVFGIEVHEVLARILKINLLLHHDGHTNVEGDRSCLDIEFTNSRLASSWRQGFHRVIGNPPFGDVVRAGDSDLLGANSLESFVLSAGRNRVPSEHLVLERGIEMLKPGGRLGFVIPDGLLNNQGEPSNCPAVRRYLARSTVIEAIVSLPDFAFRKSGAQNKTSILIVRRFTEDEAARFSIAETEAAQDGATERDAIAAGLRALNYSVFLAEAMHIGYSPTGVRVPSNDLYRDGLDGLLSDDQSDTILGEFRAFSADPTRYEGRNTPDTMSMPIAEMWAAHKSHRLDPKYFLFKREERTVLPDGWVSAPIGKVMRRREELARPEDAPDESVVVLRISQEGELYPRVAGKGRNPPEWLGVYFEDMRTRWFTAHTHDVVFSGIDLWKGCISVVPEELDGALASEEFPVYELLDDRIDPLFLSTLLRSRYYRRAFRAITTGHSNRRRTQPEDFEALEIAFPPDRAEQQRLVAEVLAARALSRRATDEVRAAMLRFSDVIDARGNEEYEVLDEEPAEEDAP